MTVVVDYGVIEESSSEIPAYFYQALSEYRYSV